MTSVLARMIKANGEGIRNGIKGLACDVQFYREKHRDSYYRNLVVALHFDDWMFLESYVWEWEAIKWR